MCNAPPRNIAWLSVLGFVRTDYTPEQAQRWLRAFNRIPPVSVYTAAAVIVYRSPRGSMAALLCDEGGRFLEMIGVDEWGDRLDKAARGEEI